jgi:pilus assembly protein Flp/PilA
MLTLASQISGALFAAREAARKLLSGHLRGIAGNERGATAIEYGLIVAGISLAVIAIVFAFGEDIEVYYQAIDTRITARTLT